MEGYIYQNAGPGGNLIVSGLTPSAQYDLYVYSEGDSGCGGRGLSLNANSVVASTTILANASANTFSEGQNYLLMHVAANSSGALNIAYSGLYSKEANVNGFQLVSAPEPVSLGLVGLGSVVLLRRRRATQA